MPRRDLSQQDFSGGINAVASPWAVTEKQIYRGRNLLLDEHGSLTTRPGYSVVATSTDTITPVLHLAALTTVSGTTYPLMIQGDGTVNVLYRFDTGARIGVFNTGYSTPQSETVNNAQIFAAGYETPWSWDGTTFAQITALGGQTVPPGAKHLAFHLSSLWLWNTNATTTTLDGPSSLRMSDANNVNSWPNANQTFIAKDDGQTGQGCASYTIAETGISPTATLVCFKDRSAYQVTGTLGGTFSVTKLKTDLGCVAPRTIQFVSGFGIIRLSHKGFALFNGVDDRLLSEEVRPYLFGRDEIGGINWATAGLSWAAQSQNPPLYVAVCPTKSTYLDRVFVYDLVRRAWAICDYPFAISSLVLYAVPNSTQPEVRAGASTGGQVNRIFNVADTSDNGAAIPWAMTSKKFGSPFRPAYWRRAFVNALHTPPQTVALECELEGPSGNTVVSANYNAAAPGATYGVGTYGSSVYGATSAVAGTESLDIQKTAHGASLTVSGAGNVRVRALGLDVGPKPVTRRATVGAV